MNKLVLGFKDTVLKEFPIDKDVVSIGRRKENDICIDNPVVSGAHARVLKQGATFILEDLQSTNGTFIGQQKVTKHVLNHKDTFMIGKHTITFISDNPAEKPAEKPAAPKVMDMDKTMVLESKTFPSAAAAAPAAGGAAAAARPTPSAAGGAAAAARPTPPAAAAGAAPGGAAAATGGAKPAFIGGVTIIEGSTDQDEYILKGRMTMIGKADNANIRLKGLLAPKTAAVINRTEEGYYITPIPGNKIKVNGEHVEERHVLKDGDIIEVAGLQMQFYMRKSS